MERLDQIINEIEFVVIHFPGHDQSGGSSTLVVKLLGMTEGDQCVTLTMDYKGWTSHILNVVYVSEAVIDYILQEWASLLFHYLSDALERRHKKQTTGSPLGSQMCCGTCTNRSSKEYYGGLRYCP